MFKTVEKESKPFSLKVNMNAAIYVSGLGELAKMILWVEENIPARDREIRIDEGYRDYDYTHIIHVKWSEERMSAYEDGL